MQNRAAVTAYYAVKQLLLFAFARGGGGGYTKVLKTVTSGGETDADTFFPHYYKVRFLNVLV